MNDSAHSQQNHLEMHRSDRRDREKAHRWKLDTMFLRGLFIMNGGGIAATSTLLTLAQGTGAYQYPHNAAFWGIVGFIWGLTLAAVHGRCQRVTELRTSQHFDSREDLDAEVKKCASANTDKEESCRALCDAQRKEEKKRRSAQVWGRIAAITGYTSIATWLVTAHWIAIAGLTSNCGGP